MRVQEVDKYLNPLISDLYSFAFALCLEDKTAKKLCKDALYLFYQKEEGLCLDISQRSSFEDPLQLRFQALLRLMKWCHRSFLALPQKQKQSENFTYFSELPPMTRGLLYCRHRKNLSYEDCELIFECSSQQLLVEINQGREFLMQGQPL